MNKKVLMIGGAAVAVVLAVVLLSQVQGSKPTPAREESASAVPPPAAAPESKSAVAARMNDPVYLSKLERMAQLRDEAEREYARTRAAYAAAEKAGAAAEELQALDKAKKEAAATVEKAEIALQTLTARQMRAQLDGR